MRTLTYTVGQPFDGAKVKDVLSKRLLVSDALISKLKRRDGGILLNGSPAYVTASVYTGDILCVSVGDAEKDPRIRPIPMPLPILYEDTDLLVIDKPAGIAVHPSRDPDEPTVENALAAYLGENENPHPVSRLDRGTTGLMTVAKTGWAHSFMKTLQHGGGMQKTYLALCKGCPNQKEGTVDAPIGFYEGSSYRREVREDGAPARTEFRVLGFSSGVSLIRLLPLTGRTHQIRVHMAFIGCPLVGDWLYGTCDPKISRPALHAFGLSFVHPLCGEPVSLEAPLPKDMRDYMDRHGLMEDR